jgi:hypothetical protein
MSSFEVKFSGSLSQSATYGHVGTYKFKKVLRVRIVLAPPRSLDCREFLPRFPAESANYARFLRFLFEKTDCGERTIVAMARAKTAFFSAAAMSGPVSTARHSEHQAITNRLPSERGLDFISGYHD